MLRRIGCLEESIASTQHGLAPPCAAVASVPAVAYTHIGRLLTRRVCCCVVCLDCAGLDGLYSTWCVVWAATWSPLVFAGQGGCMGAEGLLQQRACNRSRHYTRVCNMAWRFVLLLQLCFCFVCLMCVLGLEYDGRLCMQCLSENCGFLLFCVQKLLVGVVRRGWQQRLIVQLA